MKTGDLIMLGLVAVGGYLLYTNWPSISSALTPATAAANPAANTIIPASTPPPTQTSLVQVPVSQTPVAPGTPPATPTPPNPPSSTPVFAGYDVTAQPVSVASAFPLTTAALAAAPAGAYNSASLAQWQSTMQTYVNTAANGDNFGDARVSSVTILGLYDAAFANSVRTYLQQFSLCQASKGTWDGNGNCSGPGLSGVNTRHYRRVGVS
jgi:hypothetical protein